FTSAASGVGTTTVLLNVAITSAHQGKLRVLAADVNLHRPPLGDRLGLRSAPGLGEVLARGLGLEEALKETGQRQLRALTAGAASSIAKLVTWKTHVRGSCAT